jgi:hypothetical protein
MGNGIMEEYDEFQLESGLLGNVDLEVLDAEFTNRLDSFDPTKLELHLTVRVDGDDGGEQVVYFGCGGGWETVDGGKTAQREDGQARNFHASTKVGEFWKGLVHVMADDPTADKAIRAHVAKNGGPTRAAMWKGLRVHVAREERKGGGDISDFEVLVIDGFNGIAGGGGKAAGATKKAAKKAAGATKKAAPAAAADGGLTDAIRSTLDGIADKAESHDAFMETAFAEVPEASTDDEVKAAVSANDAESIWGQAVARYEAAVAAQAEG